MHSLHVLGHASCFHASNRVHTYHHVHRILYNIGGQGANKSGQGANKAGQGASKAGQGAAPG